MPHGIRWIGHGVGCPGLRIGFNPDRNREVREAVLVGTVGRDSLRLPGPEATRADGFDDGTGMGLPSREERLPGGAGGLRIRQGTDMENERLLCGRRGRSQGDRPQNRKDARVVTA